MLRHTAPISGIASFSNSTTKLIATAGYDNRVILWDGNTNTPLSVGYHDHLANHCDFSQCGKFLITSSSDHTARLWSIPQMKLLAVFSAHNDDVECAIIHPSNFFVATASRDHKIRLFDFNGALLRTYYGHTADVISIQWSADSKQIISSSDDGTIRVWDRKNGTQINQLNDSGIQTDALAISTENILYAGDDAGQIHLITKESYTSITAHQAGIKKLVYSHVHKKLISIAYDRKACLWNILSDGKLELQTQFSLPSLIWPRSCAFYGDNEIVFATFGSSYAVYNYNTNQWQTNHIQPTLGINAVTLDNKNNPITIGDAGFVKSNQQIICDINSLGNFVLNVDDTILTGGQMGIIYNAKSAEILYQHRSPLNCAATYFDNNYHYAVIGSYTGEAIVLKKLPNGFVIDRIIPIFNNAIKSLAISGSLLFSVCATGAVSWYNLRDNRIIKSIENAHDKIANGCIALENNFFASISRDLKLRIWNGADYSLNSIITTPHTHSIKCIACDESFNYLITGSYNGLVAIYNRGKSTWVTKRITTAGISSLCWDKSNSQFLISSYDGNLYTYSLEK
jgi:WD40 repeat protein